MEHPADCPANCSVNRLADISGFLLVNRLADISGFLLVNRLVNPFVNHCSRVVTIVSRIQNLRKVFLYFQSV